MSPPVTDEDRKEAERLASEYMGLNSFNTAISHKSIYTDDVVLGWVKDTYEVGYAAACEAKRTEIADLHQQLDKCQFTSYASAFEAERARSAKLYSVLKVAYDAVDWFEFDHLIPIGNVIEKAIAAGIGKDLK